MRVLVVPNATRSEIVGPHGDRIKIRVAVPPERGKANAEVCRLLIDTTGAVAAEVTNGLTSRTKTIALGGISSEAVRRALARPVPLSDGTM